MKVLICLLLLTGLLAETQAQYSVAIIGSSTSEGQGSDPIDSSYAQRFNYYYKYRQHILDTTYLLAKGGYSCYKGMPTGYNPPAGRDKPDVNNNVTRALQLLRNLRDPSKGIVIVNFPSNGYDIFSVEESLFCLQTIYNAVVNAGHRCFVTTTQSRSDRGFGNTAVKQKIAVLKDSIIHRFGNANTINFYDGLYDPADRTILLALSAGDQIHLNNTGHRILFERVRSKNVFAPAPSVGTYPNTIRDNKPVPAAKSSTSGEKQSSGKTIRPLDKGGNSSTLSPTKKKSTE